MALFSKLPKKSRYVLGIGHSHLYQIQVGYNENKQFFIQGDQPIEFISFLDEKYKNRALHFDPDKAEFIFHDSIVKYIQENKDNIKFIFSIFGGNSHNILGLVQLPEKFDFILPEMPSLELQDEAKILPYSLIEELMKTQGGFPETIGCLKFLRKIYTGKIIQLESPPPIEDNSYLEKFSGPFKEKFDSLGISPAIFRYKLWYVYNKLIQEECHRLEIEYLKVPYSMLSQNHFLAPIALGEDPTHANSLYGFETLKELICLK